MIAGLGNRVFLCVAPGCGGGAWGVGAYVKGCFDCLTGPLVRLNLELFDVGRENDLVMKCID